MLENPFLAAPQVESAQSRSRGRGLVFGFQGPPPSVATMSVVRIVEQRASQDKGGSGASVG